MLGQDAKFLADSLFRVFDEDNSGSMDFSEYILALNATRYTMLLLPHRRRIYTEEKTKVIATVWGTEFIQFLAALAILSQDDLRSGMILYFSSYHTGALNPFLHIILMQFTLFFI